MILFQFTGLTAGDVIEISQTKQQVSAPIQPPNTPPFLLDLQRSPLLVCYLYNERGDSLVREILRTLAQKASHLLKYKLRSVSQCYLTSGILDFKLQHKRAKYRNDMLKK